MIKVSRLADYGIVLMVRMAKANSDAIFTARDLSIASNLPLPMVSKVLKQLAREGLLTSQRGVKGGYGLAKTSDEISLADIICALDGPIALTNCLTKSEGDCGIESCCTNRGFWERVNHRVTDALETLSLTEMAIPHTSEADSY